MVRLLTKLQPHFLTPWLFQSWNLAYNVSVESDRVKDKYFYIARGIELLAQGERLNRDNPDMRFWIGFYFNNKFGSSDEKVTLRSLLQMSGIDPAKRDPNDLRPETGSSRRRTVNIAKFEQFCRENPQLVRRLRESLRCTTPDDIVDFLADNRKIPCRYVDPESDTGIFKGRRGELKSADEQFPILPVSHSRLFPDEPTASSTLGDSFCNYQYARAWFSYALDPLPEAEPMTELKLRAERLAEPRNKGRRIPRSPAEIIFRQEPARSQSFVGERLEQEGWFDESGWTVDQGLTTRNRWFEKDVVIGAGEQLAANAWSKAYEQWRTHGIANGLLLDPPTELERLRELRNRFQAKYQLPYGDSGESIRLDSLDPEMAKCLLAYRQLFYMDQNLGMTNYAHHLVRASVERDRDAVEGRKLFFEGDAPRSKENEPDRAIAAYQKGFELWIKVLSNPQYKDFRNDANILDDTYETELRYVDLLRQRLGPQARPAPVTADLLAQGAAASVGAAVPGSIGLALLYGAVTDQKILPVPIMGPLDGNDSSGVPWIPLEVMNDVRNRLNIPVGTAPATPPQPVKPRLGN